MHTCKNCMFCYYRDLRIAASGALDGVAPVRQHDAEPAQPGSPPALPSMDADADLAHALEAEVF